MTREPRAAHTFLPGFILAACVALPAGASAQTAPPATAAGSLGAAMAEARRTPFHNATGADGLTMVQLAGVPVPHAGDRQATEPSFHRVFWPTAAGVLLSEFAFLYGALHCDPDSVPGRTASGCAAGLLMGTAALVLGPPTASGIAGGSFRKGLLGSAAGLGVGFALFGLGMALGLDDSDAFWGIPAAHAILTTALAIR